MAEVYNEQTTVVVVLQKKIMNENFDDFWVKHPPRHPENVVLTPLEPQNPKPLPMQIPSNWSPQTSFQLNRPQDSKHS